MLRPVSRFQRVIDDMECTVAQVVEIRAGEVLGGDGFMKMHVCVSGKPVQRVRRQYLVGVMNTDRQNWYAQFDRQSKSAFLKGFQGTFSRPCAFREENYAHAILDAFSCLVY